MKDQLVKMIKETLEGGTADAAVFLVDSEAGPMPSVVTSAADPTIEEVCTGDERYPVAGFAVMALPGLAGRLAVVARECDRRMMIELAKHGKLDWSRLEILGIPCSQELADECGCDHPVPLDCTIETKTLPGESTVPAEGEMPDRYTYWMDHFERCIRCMGCRNICPLCYCKDCSLDNPDFTGTSQFPPEVPIFHLIRAIDMSDRCIDCGMCETVCPAEIPLRELYRMAREVVKEAFDYEPGLSLEDKSPLEILGDRDKLGGMEEGFRLP